MSLPDIEQSRDISNLDGIEYEFITERGKQSCSYGDYLKDEELRMWLGDQDRYKLILGNTLFSYPISYLQKRPSTMSALKEMEEEKRLNPLRFFAPSGKEALNRAKYRPAASAASAVSPRPKAARARIS